MPTFPISSHSMGASHWSPAAQLASVRALPVLAHAGAKVVVGDIDIDGAARVATEIGGVAMSLDVTDATDAASADQ